MSIFPLVQVEGALAMPHMRPLNRVPPPFGREWSLMPSHFSLRTELHALYAAFLRTICLSADAFRQTYRWDRQPRPRVAPEAPRPAAAPIGAALNAAQALQAAAQALGGRKARSAQSAGTNGAAQSGQPAHTVRAARIERTPPSSHKLAASAVAIGGAALLTWIVASHTQFGVDKQAPNAPTLREAAGPASKAGVQSSARLADEREQHDRSVSGAIDTPQTIATPVASHESGVAVGSTVVAQRASTPAPEVAQPQRANTAANGATVAAVAPATPTVVPQAQSAPALAVSPPSAAAQPAPAAAAARPDFAMRAQATTPVRATLASKAASEQRASTVKRRPVATSGAKATRGASQRHAAHEFAPQRSAAPVTTHRTRGMYSEAAEYSPHQFAANSGDEYSSLTTYAATAAASRPASRATVAADSTEWVNHVAQRRVTEVPDRFAK
ncbi:hypothetical protein [Paraburkholderia sp. J67]|uniref:hypothetical protein n=1 Tax=Paraburkholderia sp. J67 TaxID=2805435 RepID=UPI002ABD2BA9|nr:hypothetical protein [Paraburkholderia sp. J67]